MLNKIFTVILLLIVSVAASAQNDRDYVRRGNRLMRDSLYAKAQVQYQKAIQVDNTNAEAHYNLGNALLFQNKPQDAMKEYETATKFEKNKLRLAQMYHNMGVVLQSAKQFDKAVACYKSSLRNDPSSNETRYNYALCLYQLKNNKNNQNDQNKDKDKDKNGKDNQNEKQKQQQQKQPKQNDKKQQQQEQPDPNQMSKENAEQMLKAAMQDEKATQEKLQQAQQKPHQKHLQKQW